ncbi:hypothetical protein IK146_00880 [Candidatus Saccharibacteria bacterium]|nr:hypothetical protein [Candidatus Saccharibacteria bacterium]
MVFLDATLRRSFPEKEPIHYECVDWTPTFTQLKAEGYGSKHEITLKNVVTGELERMTFEIVGASESPVTTTKWIWGKVITDDGYDTDLTFDYVDGELVQIIAAATPKSAPVEVVKERTKLIRYPAEITTFDIFSPVEQ